MRIACENCRTQYEISEGKEGLMGCPTCGHVNAPNRPSATATVPLPEDELVDPGKTMLGSLDGEMANESGVVRQAVAGRKMQLPSGQEAALVILEGDGKGQRVVLSKTQLVIGRKQADIVLNDPEASRRHCVLQLYGDLIIVKDLNSANGTKINNRIVKEGVLRPGGTLQIGMTRFQFILQPTGGSAARS